MRGYIPVCSCGTGGHRRCINESFLMYTMRIEDADHGPEITWCDCETSRRRRAPATNGLFTVVVWMQMNVDVDSWLYPAAECAAVQPTEDGSVKGRLEWWREAHRQTDRKIFVLVNGWSVWLAFGMERGRERMD